MHPYGLTTHEAAAEIIALRASLREALAAIEALIQTIEVLTGDQHGKD